MLLPKIQGGKIAAAVEVAHRAGDGRPVQPVIDGGKLAALVEVAGSLAGEGIARAVKLNEGNY